MTIGEGMSGYERPQDGDDKSDNDCNAEQEDGDDKSVSPEERPLDGDDKSVLADGEGVEPEESIDDSYPPSSQKRLSIDDSCYPPSSQVETEAINKYLDNCKNTNFDAMVAYALNAAEDEPLSSLQSSQSDVEDQSCKSHQRKRKNF